MFAQGLDPDEFDVFSEVGKLSIMTCVVPPSLYEALEPYIQQWGESPASRTTPHWMDIWDHVMTNNDGHLSICESSVSFIATLAHVNPPIEWLRDDDEVDEPQDPQEESRCWLCTFASGMCSLCERRAQQEQESDTAADETPGEVPNQDDAAEESQDSDGPPEEGLQLVVYNPDQEDCPHVYPPRRNSQ